MGSRLVTIFGGSGFLGRHTVRALARAGWRIRVACREPNQAFFLRPLGTVGQIAPAKCDITDPDQVAAALSGADAAINLVGILYGHFEDAHGLPWARKMSPRLPPAAAGVSALVHVSAIGADSEALLAFPLRPDQG